MPFLKKVQILELKIDEFLNLVSESAILFEQVIRLYFENKQEELEDKCQRIRIHERTADEYRKNIEQHLYRHTLIPENRGDVLAIFENTDDVINQIKSVCLDLLIEKPVIPDLLKECFIEISVSSAHSVDELVKSVRAFFHNIHHVEDFAHKVFFYEKEVDDIGEKSRMKLYNTKLDLSSKLEIKNYLLEIEKISDFCQNVCDRLIIYTIKRQL